MTKDSVNIELFILKCAVIESELRTIIRSHSGDSIGEDFSSDNNIDEFVRQFGTENRTAALRMSEHYRLFYMLENDIRSLISDTLETAHGDSWWDKCISQAIRDEVKRLQTREDQAAITPRSEESLDYTTFGQLSDIIKDNWPDFAGMMSNQPAVIRVLSSLNMLRGAIAHCGILADDEVDRLHLAIRDWFRVLEGPRNR